MDWREKEEDREEMKVKSKKRNRVTVKQAEAITEYWVSEMVKRHTASEG